KLLVAAVLIVLVELGYAPAWVVIIIISRELAGTGLRLVAAGEGIVLAAGSMGKIKTATQMIAVATLRLNNIPFSYIVFLFAAIMLFIATFFTVICGYEDFHKNWHVMKGSK